MPGRSEAVASHAAIVFFFVGCLAVRSKTDNNIASLNPAVINHIASFHSAYYRTVYCNRSDEVAQIGCFAPGANDVETMLAQHGQYFFRAVNDRRYYFTRDQVFITADG